MVTVIVQGHNCTASPPDAWVLILVDVEKGFVQYDTPTTAPHFIPRNRCRRSSKCLACRAVFRAPIKMNLWPSRWTLPACNDKELQVTPRSTSHTSPLLLCKSTVLSVDVGAGRKEARAPLAALVAIGNALVGVGLVGFLVRSRIALGLRRIPLWTMGKPKHTNGGLGKANCARVSETSEISTPAKTCG